MPSDLERGPRPLSGRHRSQPSGVFSRLPRRKLPVILFACIAFFTLTIFFYDGLAAQSTRGLRYVKDSMRPWTSDSLLSHSQAPAAVAAASSHAPQQPSSSKLAIPKTDTLQQSAAASAPAAKAASPSDGVWDKRPSDALVTWAKEHGHPVATPEDLKADPTRAPSAEEKVLLLLQALKDDAWRVPSSWASLLSPKTGTEFAKSLTDTVRASTAAEDAKLYLESPARWVNLHRDNNRLTVFSKSYCPFSKKAKALLASLNATFTVHEVDLRADAEYLQPALASVSGHRTYPTIFVQGTLLGGSDDLEDLHHKGVLEGILRGAYVL